jgi:hypothetical protein
MQPTRSPHSPQAFFHVSARLLTLFGHKTWKWKIGGKSKEDQFGIAAKNHLEWREIRVTEPVSADFAVQHHEPEHCGQA